jgi:hypothetical protein
MADVVSIDAMFKDFYPLPGTRLKQYVVDMRAQHAWEAATCPAIDVGDHLDNTGAFCREAPRTLWKFAAMHDCCAICNGAAADTKDREDVRLWLLEKAARPPIETDRAKLSDEIEPERTLPGWPALFKR